MNRTYIHYMCNWQSWLDMNCTMLRWTLQYIRVGGTLLTWRPVGHWSCQARTSQSSGGWIKPCIKPCIKACKFLASCWVQTGLWSHRLITLTNHRCCWFLSPVIGHHEPWTNQKPTTICHYQSLIDCSRPISNQPSSTVSSPWSAAIKQAVIYHYHRALLAIISHH